MALPGFTTADQRLQDQSGIKAVILGPSGIGKTTLLLTLDPHRTLFINAEAGDLSIKGWPGDEIDVRTAAQKTGLPTWAYCQNLAVWLAGPDPSKDANAVYGVAHYNHVVSQWGDPAPFRQKYDTYFIDSLTVFSRLCFTWARSQPDAFSEKTGKPDTRGAYGLLGREMKDFITQLQHAKGKNVIFLGILDKVKDDMGRSSWEPQIEGSQTALALPGIVDQVISMVEMDFPGADGQPPVKQRVFVTQTMNQWGYPAKDRSGQLEMLEEPHLGRLFAKIEAGTRQRALSFAAPPKQAA